MVERTFKDIPDGKITEADQQSFLIGLGWARGSTWDELLESPRVLLVSEAGAGKTYECRSQTDRLKSDGQHAFFLDLADLASNELRSLLDLEEEAQLDAWLVAQSDSATFFLDSIDELKLTEHSFELALKRLKKAIGNQLHRAKFVITTRPIPFDEQLIRRILPIPEGPATEPDGAYFARVVMRESVDAVEETGKNRLAEWRTVALMPLSDDQIAEFANNQGLNDPDVLLDDLRKRNAQDFARRPQDLIELCADWRVHKRIRTHLDQVNTNIRVKLLPSPERTEKADLSFDMALEGASRLALASLLTRRQTIRHNAASDINNDESVLDPAVILSDWQHNERLTLLERPLFNFASYGRVRFHHRSVIEYLAAKRLLDLRHEGMSLKALKRLIFAESRGQTIVRPSKRPVAAWLALNEDKVFELIRDNEPAVVLNDGDPESLRPAQRSQILQAYCDHYGTGNWRGLRVASIQVNRFATPELEDDITQIWRQGVENPDVRHILIGMIEAG